MTEHKENCECCVITQNEKEERISSGEWELIKVCPDSGAAKFVAPEKMCSHIPTMPSEASKKGVKYRAANGQTIPNEGEKIVNGEDVNGEKIEATWQIAGVTKPLGSVMEMADAGNRVTFDRDENGNNISRIYNKRKGKQIPSNVVGSAYEFDMWVKKSGAAVNRRTANVKQDNHFQELTAEEDEEDDEEDEGVKELTTDGVVSFHRLVEVL